MASQSPVQGEGVEAYRSAWAQISGSLSSGTSWSGHEHNNAWINLGGGRFQDISDTTGLAFDADGRGVARVDWDGDGDLDLWIRSRSAPGLRYMENQSNPRHIHLSLRALGPDGQTHRADAIGAQVRLISNARTTVHGIRAGEGYLSQSSDQLVRGLKRDVLEKSRDGGAAAQVAEKIVAVEVTWPNGEIQKHAVEHSGDGGFQILQGQVSPQPLMVRSWPKPLLAGPLEVGPAPTRTVLRSTLPMPWRRGLDPEGKGRLVLICTGPKTADLDPRLLKELRGQHGLQVEVKVAHTLTDLGADWKSMPLLGQSFEDLSDVQVAGWQALQKHILTFAEPDLVLWLLDGSGAAQVLYQDGWDSDQVGKDIERFVKNRCKGAERGAGEGRWFHGAPRGLKYLSRELRTSGSVEWADSYSD